MLQEGCQRQTLCQSIRWVLSTGDMRTFEDSFSHELAKPTNPNLHMARTALQIRSLEDHLPTQGICEPCQTKGGDLHKT